MDRNKYLNKFLEIILIDRSKLQERGYLLRLSSIFILMVLISIREAFRLNIMGDFAVFWNAGNNYLLHNNLYSGIGGAQRFIYPPFAAMLFQLLAIFPMPVAAGLFTFFNLLLILITVYLTRAILKYYFTDLKKINQAIVIAFLFSLRFFWYHTMFIQMNELILVLSLWGVLLVLKNRDITAAISFVIASFIKIIPVFFLVWMAFKVRFKTYLTIGLAVVIFVMLPLLLRGWELGMQDLRDYYITFLGPFKEGRVEAQFHNHSLSSAIYNISLPMNDILGFDFNIFHLTQAIAKKIYLYSFIFLFSFFVFAIGFVRLKKKPVSHLEISLILLAMHLLSGITWEYHLVSLLFVYSSFLMLSNKANSIFHKSIRYFILALIILNAIVGIDTVGTTFYHYFGGYGVLTWMMVILFFYFWYALIFGMENEPMTQPSLQKN